MIRILFLAMVLTSNWVLAQELLQPPTRVLIVNARVFDGRSDALTAPMNVLIVGNRIERLSDDPIDPGEGVSVIDAGGRTLMPGLIDAHTHLMFSTLSIPATLTSDLGYLSVVAAKGAERTLLRGFTSVRDLGGPIFGLKKAIANGSAVGPRIWPSGPFISQSGGHGDFRLPNELPAAEGAMNPAERMGGTVIADPPDLVRKRTREVLALGASQIKLMAGGGISSSYDPLDVTQYTVEELRAAVEAAENWGTYVTVHAYTPRAVRQAIEAGVKCIDHGQLLDEETVQLMAEKGIWWSLQPFIEDGKSVNPEGSPNRLKQQELYAGTDRAFALAKQHRVKIAFGTDKLFDARAAALQGTYLVRMKRWFTPVEVLRMATSGNAELLALSGNRSPYAGKLGVIEAGALADLLIIDGDPIANLELLENPEQNLVLIMKDGQVYKNTLHRAH